MIKNLFIPILTVVCIIPSTNITASAATEIKQSSNVIVYSTGIILGYSVSISGSGNALYLTAKTTCNTSMKSVGLKNVVIQRSSNNSSWSDYLTISDLLSENSTKYATNNTQIATVTSGYYYRIICTHYAKETGLFGSSESISNTSNSLYIS